MTAEKGKRAAYTLEYKLEAVRLVQGGQACAVTAQVLGIPKQTLENWVRHAAKGNLTGAGSKPVSAEQMELQKASLDTVLHQSDAVREKLVCGTVEEGRISIMSALRNTDYRGKVTRYAPVFRCAARPDTSRRCR